MSDSVQSFLEASNKINSKTVTLTRFQILALLAYFKDGIQYRELQVALGISDGKLFSNLTVLKSLGLVRCFKAKIDNKELDVYTLTNEGREELERTTVWMSLVQNLVCNTV
jgi:DNA-binding MarR family transcriptional regulator